jgi:hypothetical protein
LEERIISFPFVRSEEQLADMLTKGVSTKCFEESIVKLGMVDIYLPTNLREVVEMTLYGPYDPTYGLYAYTARQDMEDEIFLKINMKDGR